MQVILKENVKKLGKKGEVIKVSEGYARNLLFPKKLAVEATKKSLEQLSNKKGREEEDKEYSKLKTQELLSGLKNQKVTIKAKSDKTGKLYGGLTASQIAEGIEKEVKVNLPASAIILDHPIKATGEYKIKVNLENIKGEIFIEIV
jgi:large subunit ribosomal protein L9